MNSSNVSNELPAEVIDAFTSAAMTALQELARIEAFSEPGQSIAEIAPGPAVSATIRLLRHVPGTMTLVMMTDVAAQLAARYLPEGTGLSEEMIDDVAGEFANVIAGQAKTILKGTSYHFTMSTPVVVRVASFAQLPQVAETSIVSTLISELGQVLVLVNLPPCPNA